MRTKLTKKRRPFYLMVSIGLSFLPSFLFCSEGYTEPFGRPLFRHFDVTETGGASANWDVATGPDGLVYFANSRGVLIYNGVRWQIINTPQGLDARAIAITDNGKVYVGAKNDFGYLVPIGDDEWRYQSLLPAATLNETEFEETVSAIHVFNSSVFFITEKGLYRLSNNKLEAWEPGAFQSRSFTAYEFLFANIRGSGLLRFTDNGFVPVEGGEIFSNSILRAVLPQTSGKTILLGRSGNAYELVKDGNRFRVQSTATEIWKKLSTPSYSSIWKVPHGYVAVSPDGMFFLDFSGQVISKIHQYNDAGNTKVRKVYPGPNGSIWVSLNRGGSLIDNPHRVTAWSEKNGLSGDVLSVSKLGETVYVGTDEGLFRTEDQNSQMQQISGLDFPIHGLSIFRKSSIRDHTSILAATETGLYEVANGTVRRVTDGLCLSVHVARNQPNRIVLGMENGLLMLDYTASEWFDRGYAPGSRAAITSLAEDNEGTLFSTTADSRIIIYDAEAWLKPADEQGPINYSPKEMSFPEITVPGITSKVFSGRDTIWYATGLSIRKFDRAAETFRSYTGLSAVLGSVRPIWYGAAAHSDDSIWFQNSLGAGVIFPEELKQLTEIRYYPEVPMTAPDTTAFFLTNDSVFFGGSMGLVRLRRNMLDQFDSFTVRIVMSRNKQSLSRQVIQPKAPDYRIEFGLSAPLQGSQDQTKFRYRLSTLSSEWSAWQSSSTVPFTNLRLGSYTFEAQAQSRFGKLSSISSYNFQAEPLWYQTGTYNLAQAGLAITMLLIMLLFGGIRFRLVAIRFLTILLVMFLFEAGILYLDTTLRPRDFMERAIYTGTSLLLSLVIVLVHSWYDYLRRRRLDAHYRKIYAI